jgi:Tetracyclin repressor-like, C-terminal domain
MSGTTTIAATPCPMTTHRPDAEPLATAPRPVTNVTRRGFALDRPALYALMFERPLPDFNPAPQLRTEALGTALTLLTEEVRQPQQHGLLAGQDPAHTSYLLWTAIHGMTSIELTHAQRSALPGLAVDSRESGEQVLVDGIRALLAGLKVTEHPVDLCYASP